MLLRTLFALFVLAPGALAGTLFVNANLTTGMNDGSSWANAFQGDTGLKKALNVALAGDQVFVAQGTYRPAAGANRNLSFSLMNDVEIYGSFAGGETSPAQRPAFGSAPSILDGDLGEDDGGGNFGDNSYHLVRTGTVNPSAVLDGFVIRGGNSNGTGNNDTGGGILCLNGASPTIRNCRFVNNSSTFGGGAAYINNATPSFTDCTFEDNLGGSFGGAIDIATGGPVRFERCVFRGNSAARAGALEIFATDGVVLTGCLFTGNTSTGSGGGGALWIGSGGTTVLNGCTIVANSATAQTVGGLRDQGATAVNVSDSIFWDNQGSAGGQGPNNQVSPSVNVTYSIVEGGFAGAGNLNADPLFVNSPGGDFRLLAGSPAIDAGDNTSVPTGVDYDLGIGPRFVDDPATLDSGNGVAPLVDMGAFEFSIGVADLYCVPNPNSTGVASILKATGSLALVDNDVNLVAADLPASEFGYFLMSQNSASFSVASGVLCIGAPQIRFSADILNSGAAGTMSFSPDNTNLPSGLNFQAGETWIFQLWHRDGLSSNFSSSLGFTWE
jgi:Right handed beta helix region